MTINVCLKYQAIIPKSRGYYAAAKFCGGNSQFHIVTQFFSPMMVASDTLHNTSNWWLKLTRYYDYSHHLYHPSKSFNRIPTVVINFSLLSLSPTRQPFCVWKKEVMECVPPDVPSLENLPASWLSCPTSLHIAFGLFFVSIFSLQFPHLSKCPG